MMDAVPPVLAATLASGSIWFWMTDADHRFTGISDQMHRLTGSCPSQYLGRSRMDLVVGLGAYTPEGEAHIRCLNNHEPFRDFTYLHTFASGRRSWVSVSGQPITDGQGNFRGYHGIAQLLSGALEQAGNSLESERELLAHTAELQRRIDVRTDALDQSYRLLSEVLESMDQGLMVYDGARDGTFDVLLANARYATLMQLPRSLAQAGRTLNEIMDYCEARGDFRNLPGGRQDVRAAAIDRRPILLAPGDGLRTILYHAIRRSDAGGVVTLTDVTAMEDRKNALELARRTAQDAAHLLSEVVEAMGEGLMVSSGLRLDDPDNRLMMVNPAYCRLFDLEMKDIPTGMSMREHMAFLIRRGAMEKDTDIADVERRLRRGGQVMFHLPTNGRSYCVRASRRPSGGVVFVHTDVTDLHARNQLLEGARQDAEQANRAKSDFLAAMSHEIRTPMNGIVGMAELLLESDLDDDQLLFARTIVESGAALTDVIGDILDFSKIEAGKMTLSSGPVDLVAVAGNVRLLLAGRAGKSDVELRLDYPDDFPRLRVGDGTRLRQILINLVGNAIKFTHRGHVTIALRCGADDGVILSVTDTGIGIPSDRLASIFNAFDQVENGGADQYGGTGLGLEITRRLVYLMGGSVWASSEIGRGSVFTVNLPLRQTTTCHVPVAPVRDMGSHDGVAGRHILVAEDNRTNQLVLRHMLAPLGARLTFCSDGVEVVDAFCAHGADVILMDVSMPRKDGIAATRDIRAWEEARGRHPSPIIALTGNATSQDQIRCLEVGMNGFLTKPLSKSSLLVEIARVLPQGDAGATRVRAG